MKYLKHDAKYSFSRAFNINKRNTSETRMLFIITTIYKCFNKILF